MHQQLWGYKVEEKLYMGVREQKRLNTTGLNVIYGFSPYLKENTTFHHYKDQLVNAV
jgi:hypothetical protein